MTGPVQTRRVERRCCSMCEPLHLFSASTSRRDENDTPQYTKRMSDFILSHRAGMGYRTIDELKNSSSTVIKKATRVRPSFTPDGNIADCHLVSSRSRTSRYVQTPPLAVIKLIPSSTANGETHSSERDGYIPSSNR